MYLFVQPYKTRSANIVEAILATNLLLLLLVKSTSLEIPTFISLRDPSNEMCIDSALHVITISTIVLTPGYYLPVIVFILITTGSAINVIR